MTNAFFVKLFYSICIASSVVVSRYVTIPKWVHWDDVIRSDLFPAGFNNGKPNYIGRAHFNDGIIPGNVHEYEQQITFAYNGTRQAKDGFEFLVYPSGTLFWMQVAPVNNVSCLPDNMFPGGVDPTTNATLYICRAWCNNDLVVGIFTGEVGVCEVAIADEYHTYDNFDVLVKNNLDTCPQQRPKRKEGKVWSWIDSAVAPRSELIPAGSESNVTLYVGRASMYGGFIPGKAKVNSDKNDFWFTFNGKEHYKNKFELLVYPSGTLIWVEVATVNNKSCLPENVFPGGVDPRDDGVFYICRTWHDKHLLIGKVTEKSGTCEVGHDSLENAYDMFEVLVENGPKSCSSFVVGAHEDTSHGYAIGVPIFIFVLGISICLVYYILWPKYLRNVVRNAAQRSRTRELSPVESIVEESF